MLTSSIPVLGALLLFWDVSLRMVERGHADARAKSKRSNSRQTFPSRPITTALAGAQLVSSSRVQSLQCAQDAYTPNTCALLRRLCRFFGYSQCHWRVRTEIHNHTRKTHQEHKGFFFPRNVLERAVLIVVDCFKSGIQLSGVTYTSPKSCPSDFKTAIATLVVKEGWMGAVQTDKRNLKREPPTLSRRMVMFKPGASWTQNTCFSSFSQHLPH